MTEEKETKKLSFKDRLKAVKDKAIWAKDKAVNFWAAKISNSRLIIKDEDEFYDFIDMSKNKKSTTDDGEERIYTKRVIVIAWDSEEDFFQDFVLTIPKLLTKTFSQSVKLKMIDTQNIQIDLTKFEIESFPCMIVFENKEIYKKIYGEENIKKLFKWFNFDINKAIDEA